MIKNELALIEKICENVSLLNKFDTNSDPRTVTVTIQINTRFERIKLVQKQQFPTIGVLTTNKEEFQRP